MLAIRVVGLVGLLAGAAGAAEMRDAAQVAAGIAPSVLARLQAAPDRYVDRTAEMIAGYGGAEGIDANGIARYIAVTRAEARALRFRDLLAADLDNDGAVTDAEVATLAPLLGARDRGRLVRGHAQGDTDEDGVLTAGELQRLAERAGLRRVSEATAAGLQGLMAFDLDGNGLVSATEVTAVVAAAARIAPGPERVAARES
jgi:hypothetical protein